ncbi:MAG: fluoride efflux transporter FluC [Vicinamibacterales bacterium]
MERLFWICLAGAAGTGTRYVIALWAARLFGSAFPYGTLIVNLGGCFALAALMQMALTLAWAPTARAALTIGFLGGLTTYSSFNYETARLLEEGSLPAAGVNVALTVLGGLAAGWLGLICARWLVGR